jgi:hypothetical protein
MAPPKLSEDSSDINIQFQGFSSLSLNALNEKEKSETTLTPISASATTSQVSIPSTQVIRFKCGLKNTVWECLRDRGWKETDSDTDWDFFWADVHWIHETFDHVYLQEQQRINHFRNHYELTRKDLLVKNVKRMIKTIEKEYGKQEAQKFEFLATSYVLPQEHALFSEEFKKNPGIWIMKPVGKAQGKGIFLVNKMSQVANWKKDPRLKGKSDEEGQPEAYIVQKYIQNPYLIGGKKFDIRTYVILFNKRYWSFRITLWLYIFIEMDFVGFQILSFQ